MSILHLRLRGQEQSKCINYSAFNYDVFFYIHTPYSLILILLFTAHVSQCWNSLINAAMSDVTWFDLVISQTGQQIKDFLCSHDPITFEK